MEVTSCNRVQAQQEASATCDYKYARCWVGFILSQALYSQCIADLPTKSHYQTAKGYDSRDKHTRGTHGAARGVTLRQTDEHKADFRRFPFLQPSVKMFILLIVSGVIGLVGSCVFLTLLFFFLVERLRLKKHERTCT